MKPKYWGNGSWLLIFIIIFKLEKDIETLKYFLYLICSSLPCEECVGHIMENFDKFNVLNFTTSKDLLLFFVKLRNEFQRVKKNYNCIIPIEKLTFNDNNEITKQSKALIISKFYIELNKKEANERSREINKLYKLIYKLNEG